MVMTGSTAKTARNRSPAATITAKMGRQTIKQRGRAPAQKREMPHVTPLLLTVEDAARKLGIGKSLMYKLIWDGDVTSIMIGRFRRVAVSELERYIESGMLVERLARGGRVPKWTA